VTLSRQTFLYSVTAGAAVVVQLRLFCANYICKFVPLLASNPGNATVTVLGLFTGILSEDILVAYT